MKKSTHEPYKTELFVPIIKEAEGKYIAVLSDNSVDRDDEKLSRGCVEKLGMDDGYLAAFCNHQNDVFMQVAEWTNRGIKEIDGHVALIAEPKFYKSNPKAMIIKGMLDEGAKFGVSIGAIVKNFDEVDGMRVFTELELLEASFVGIPSNKHGRAMAVAKSYNKNMEVRKMDKEFTQKDIDSAIEKKEFELKEAHKKEVEVKTAEISKLTKDLEKSVKLVKEAEEDADKAKEDAESAEEEAEKKVEEAEKKVKEAGKKALEKQRLSSGESEGTDSGDVDKAFKEGKLPFVRV